MDQTINPSIIKRRRRIALAVTGAILSLACAAVWGVNRAVAPSADAGELNIAEVHRGSVADTISASGIVVPVHEEQVPSPIPTRIAKVHARPGQQVAAGALLLELDNQSVKLELERLKEQLAQQDNRIQTLRLEQEQKRKQLASGIELLQLDLQSTRAKLQRSQTLRLHGGVSAEDLLTAELNVKRNEIQLRQQQEQIDDVRRSTASNIEGAQLQQSILRKQLAQQEELLARTQVRAPFAGMLTWLLQDEGAAVAAGQLVARVTDLHNYRVEATLSDFHSRRVEPGQQVLVEQGSLELQGKVHTILPEIQDGTVKLLVTLEQPNHPQLRNKLRVDANIVAARKEGALVVARGPAFNGRGQQAAFVVDGGTARKAMLDIGASDGKQIEILGGARAGDRIVISDTTRFKDYDSFRIAK
ncbi:efflux RND transporter periplasmic adaptor subunit [Pseudoduganella violaceinigra]|uniref:efflux RND transporter periplasmic adaptor subunit n=1 Tax=Pseudoduganella violaceinigra TaxID=246602 RepID=UPI0004151AF4|nr:HlyD family efflux transporter periplasmic adaptor subunit [Pseudoduganella violaceinigra]